MARRRRGRRDETEMSRLLNNDDDTLTDEARSSTASNEKLRFMVLGGDDELMDKACATILGERENTDAFKFGEWKPREAQREEEVQVKENELHEKQRKLDRRVKELDDRQRILDEREKQLEIRERKVRQRDPGSSEHHQSTAEDPSVAEDKNRPLDECEGELKSREHSQAGESHGIHKPIRRNSKELEPPDSLLLNYDDDTLTDEAGSSTASNEKLRFMVLGGAELKSTDSSQASGSLEIQKPVRRNSMEFPPNMSEDKLKPQEDTGSLEFEGLKLVRQNNKKSDPLDMSEDKLKPQEDTGYLEFERLQLVEQKSKELDSEESDPPNEMVYSLTKSVKPYSHTLSPL
ncbi:golgin subfamily A member 6 2 [Labeo rohita]|uniref:Golgin subfamily A member 6 2 n=1 Tax=Labeo rohita TaxID=84645 RepID=A0A498LWC6_LABRO|nr:golgin subfamily A member 6 2 [Labeo rohita]